MGSQRSLEWGLLAQTYRMKYRELIFLFLNYNFSILLDTRIGPYQCVSPYRAVSDKGTGVERISSREWREKQRELQISNLRWIESYQRLDVNVLLTLITFKFMDMKI